MKIFFCDICNESIPMKLVQEGQVHTVKGKVICSSCLPMATTSSAAPIQVSSSMPRSRGGSAPWVAGFALILAAGAAGVTGWGYLQIRDRLDELDARMAKSLTASDIAAAESRGAEGRGEIVKRLDGFGDRLHALESGIGAIDTLRGDLKASERAAKEARETLSKDMVAVREDGKALLGRMVRLETEMAKAGGERDAFAQSLARLSGRVDMVGNRGADSGPVTAPPPKGTEGGNAVPVDDLPSAVASQVNLLQDKDASKVWAALTELGNTPDPRVIPYVIPTLGHSDAFVRHAATMLLGDLNAKESVGRLVQALSDEEPFVREGAHAALRKITRQNFRFDAHGTPEQRGEAKAVWEKWWSNNRDKLLGS